MAHNQSCIYQYGFIPLFFFEYLKLMRLYHQNGRQRNCARPMRCNPQVDDWWSPSELHPWHRKFVTIKTAEPQKKNRERWKFFVMKQLKLMKTYWNTTCSTMNSECHIETSPMMNTYWNMFNMFNTWGMNSSWTFSTWGLLSQDISRTVSGSSWWRLAPS